MYNGCAHQDLWVRPAYAELETVTRQAWPLISLAVEHMRHFPWAKPDLSITTKPKHEEYYWPTKNLKRKAPMAVLRNEPTELNSCPCRIACLWQTDNKRVCRRVMTYYMPSRTR